MSNDREKFLIGLMKYIGVPYTWGSKDPAYGLDCSGLIYNIFKNELKIEPTTIMNSQGYFNYFKLVSNAQVLPGASDLGDLLFFGENDNSIVHIAMCLDNKLMLEAAHGDRSITNIHIALVKGAKVMVNPIARRKDMRAIIRPHKLNWSN